MKIIITGATGRVGGAALQSALSNPAITSIIVISRRDIGIQNTKLQVIIKTDFLQYSNDELVQLKGAEACIWALGAPTSSADIHVQYPLAAQKAFAASLAPHTPNDKPFRFVLVSGGLVIRDQNTRLPPGMAGFKQRGQVEQDFVDFEDLNAGMWKSIIARPWMVIMPGSWTGWVIPSAYQIPVEVLADALIDVACSGTSEQTLDNTALVRIGQKAAAGK